MDFVADESCAGPVIQALREAGHDVVAIAEVAKGASDDQVLECALKEKRVLITEDRDFGELVYARGRSSAGVIQTTLDLYTQNDGDETRGAQGKYRKAMGVTAKMVQ